MSEGGWGEDKYSTAVSLLPLWYRTLNMQERASSFEIIKSGPKSEFERNGIQSLIDRWCHTHAASEISFHKRLAAAGLPPDSFIDIFVGSGISRDLIEGPPEWIEWFATAMRDLQDLSWARLSPFFFTRRESFARIISPLLCVSLDKVADRAKQIRDQDAGAPFVPSSCCEIFLSLVIPLLEEILNPALVLKMWEAKKRNELVGQNGQERFDYFMDSMCTPSSLHELFNQYPVLARLVTEQLLQCTDFILEFFERVAADWPDIINSFFGGADQGQIQEIRVTGDRHDYSRTVLLITCVSGETFVYKPRPQGIGLHFQQLLGWLNERNPNLRLRRFLILDRGAYGWTEFVMQEECKSEADVSCFYERQGALLAILYALGGSDIHQENVIASGDQPVLVDLEALFQPAVVEVSDDSPDAASRRVLFDSVMRVGLLPTFLGGFQLGGVTARMQQSEQIQTQTWVNKGTDRMKLVLKPTSLSPAKNLPVFAGKEMPFTSYMDSIISGFEKMIDSLIEHRAALLSRNGPLSWFAYDSIRILLRNTDFYGRTLRQSYHPRVVHDGLERDLEVFDHLWKATESRPRLSKVFNAECDALWRGDIPLFITNTSSRHLREAAGQEYLGFFDKSGMECSVSRISHLSESELGRQLWFVRAALASAVDRPRSVPIQARIPTKEHEQRVRSEDLIRLATCIGDRIASVGCWTPGSCLSWLGMVFADNHWTIQPIGFDLYGGTSGILLFFGYLSEVTGSEKYKAVAYETLETLRRQLNTMTIKSIGAFDGMGGVVYVFSHLAAIWKDPVLLREGEGKINDLLSLIAANRSLDIISGAAGAIAGLLAISSISSSRKCNDAAILCAEQILQLWDPEELPLTGFGHGAAGIAWALLQMYDRTRREDFLLKAREIIQYERSIFSPEAGNWPDLRGSDSKTQSKSSNPDFKVAWCHGATGIGLARITSDTSLWDNLTTLEISTAIRTTLTARFGLDHSLCHGDLGRLELLEVGRDFFNESYFPLTIETLMAATYREICENGCICGVPLGIEVPGFMAGLAGIGYEMLRMALPHQVPSVLTLAGPLIKS